MLLTKNQTFRVITDVLSHFGYPTKAHRKAIWRNPKVKYELWFMNYDLYRMPNTSNPAGQNDISEDQKSIIDRRLDALHYTQGDHIERLVFAKIHPGRLVPYTFLGKYKHIPIDTGENESHWERISETFQG